MRIETSREKKLPSYSMDLIELEALIKKISSLFEDKDEVCYRIEIKIKNKKINFENIEELKNYPDLHQRITKFCLYFYTIRYDKSVFINSSGLLSSNPSVTTTSNDEIWCLTMNETIYSHLTMYRQWFSLLNTATAKLIIQFLLMLGLIYAATLKVEIEYKIIFIISITPFLLLHGFQNKILPPTTLRIKDSETFLKKYNIEITIIIAFIAIIISTIALFKK